MSLSVWQRNIVTESGDVIPDAEIEVFDAGSSSKPDLFSDPDGDSSITNPFNADSNGFARFYVSGGRYDIAVNGTVLWEDVALGTTQSRDTGTGDDEVPTNAEFGGPTPSEIGRGAIVESGSNSNGHYVRWENGEQVVWHRVGSTRTTETAVGNVFRSGSWEPEVPASFVSEPSVLGALFDVSGAPWVGRNEPLSSTQIRVRVMGSSDDDGAKLGYVAWGFWK